MTPFDFHNTIRRVQDEFDLSRLSLGGVNYWMVVRLMMLSHLGVNAARGTQALMGQKAHSRMIDNPLAKLETSDTKIAAYRQRSVGNSAILFQPPGCDRPQGKFIFYELPVDYTQVIDGRAVNRIADGFVEAFGDDVQKVCRFEFGLFRSACRFDPIYLMLCQDVSPELTAEKAVFAQAVYDLCLALQRISPSFAVSPAQIITNVNLIMRQAAAHEQWLTDLNPKAVAFQCFISMEKMGLLIACKRLGITTLEVQHGYCDAYSIFNDMPESDPCGQAIMPDVFWAWGDMTTQALRKDSGFVENHVKVICGGDVWGALSYRSAEFDQKVFLSRIGASDYSRRILIGYQVESLADTAKPGSAIPQMLIETIVSAPKNWLWLFRVHPRSSHMVEPIAENLRGLGVTNFEVEVTTMERVETVLSASDCYITGFSVSALEANSIGKPVIIIDNKVGKHLFGELFDAGVFRFADTAEDLMACLRDIKPPARDAGYYVRDLSTSRHAFDSIMTGTYEALPEPSRPGTPLFVAPDDVGEADVVPMVPDPALIHAAEEAPIP